MVAIRLESRGPVIYRQRRAGLHGRQFDVLKLRTMVDGAEHIGAGSGDERRTTRASRAWAALLRRTSLDELPNLLNVLRGEMSLIGPRPTLPVQVAQYTERQRGRLAIKPGITGWAQVNGRASLPWSERIELDLYYIEHRSLALDLQHPVAHARAWCSAARACTRAMAAAGRGSCEPARASQPALGRARAFTHWNWPRRAEPRRAGRRASRDPADRRGQAL